MLRRKLRRTGATLAPPWSWRPAPALDETRRSPTSRRSMRPGGTEEAEDDASDDADDTEVAGDDVGADEPTEARSQRTTPPRRPMAIPTRSRRTGSTRRTWSGCSTRSSRSTARRWRSPWSRNPADSPPSRLRSGARDLRRNLRGPPVGRSQRGQLSRVRTGSVRSAAGALACTVTDVVSADPQCLIVRRLSTSRRYSRTRRIPEMAMWPWLPRRPAIPKDAESDSLGHRRRKHRFIRGTDVRMRAALPLWSIAGVLPLLARLPPSSHVGHSPTLSRCATRTSSLVRSSA
jgi:hypothetical protein